MSKELYPKVLLCCPQHESKMYCWDIWHERASNLTYPNYSIFIADNSPTMENVHYMNTFDKVKAVYTPDRKKGILSRINDSHKQCADYALANGYKWVFHLESDIIPPLDVIERLMARTNPERQIISGTYDIFFGETRKAMVQMKEGLPRTVHGYNVVDFLEQGEPLFYDGQLREVFHAGLGCILINSMVFKSIKFRVQKGIDFHTDTLFANDCYQFHKDIFVDTTVQCEHYNQTWLAKK